MERKRIIILGCGVLAAFVLTAAAIAQVREAFSAAPAETTLQPSQVDSRALAQARRSPLATRIRSVLANDANSARILAQAQASSVPVLAPPDPGLLQTSRFYPGDRQYTLVVRRPGMIVEILGSTLAFQGARSAGPSPRPINRRVFIRAQRQTPLSGAVAQAEALGLSNIQSERTEYGTDVSFVRFGVVYSVSFVCDDLASLECSDAAAVQFATRLELIGGGQ